MQVMRVALVVAVMVAAASAQSVNFTSYFTGGLPFCTQCGTTGQYACSPDESGTAIGNWNNGVLNFADPLPANAIPHTLTVKIYGTWSCSPTIDDSMFGLSLNGLVHAVREAEKGTSDCKCNSCDNVETMTFSFRNGIPSYIHNAYNSLRFVMYRNSVCLNRAEVTIAYETSASELPHMYKSLKPSGGQNLTCNVCNGGEGQFCSSSTVNLMTIEFTDPLPSGALLVGVDVYHSYNFVEKSYQYSTTMTATLTGTTIASATYSDAGFTNKCGCYGDSRLMSPFYQRGWPGYVARGQNKLTFNVNKYSSSYGNMCFGRVGLDLIYYLVEANGDAVLHRIGATATEQGRLLF